MKGWTFLNFSMFLIIFLFPFSIFGRDLPLDPASLGEVPDTEVAPGRLYFYKSLNGKNQLSFTVEPNQVFEGEDYLNRLLAREYDRLGRSVRIDEINTLRRFANARIAWWGVRAGTRLKGWRFGNASPEKRERLFLVKERLGTDGIFDLETEMLSFSDSVKLPETLVVGGNVEPFFGWQYDEKKGEWFPLRKIAVNIEKSWVPWTGSLSQSRIYDCWSTKLGGFAACLRLGESDGTIKWRYIKVNSVVPGTLFGGKRSENQWFKLVADELGKTKWVSSPQSVSSGHNPDYYEHEVYGPTGRDFLPAERTFVPEEHSYDESFLRLRDALKFLTPYGVDR